MSKIGKKPIAVKDGVLVTLKNREIRVEGPKGQLSFNLPEGINVRILDNKLEIYEENKEGKTKALFGLTRAMVANMINGVSLGFEKRLELSGVGYRAQVSGDELILSVGFSNSVKIKAVPGINFTVADNNIIVSGKNKELVGDIASKIRKVRPPEPYKGKGIRYLGERIRRKAGKAAKALGAK